VQAKGCFRSGAEYPADAFTCLPLELEFLECIFGHIHIPFLSKGGGELNDKVR